LVTNSQRTPDAPTGRWCAPLDTLTNWDIFVRILVSLLAGTFIGIEREWHDKPAGIRTYALVCEGSALFMITSLLLGQQVMNNNPNYDPSRIASTVVQGIGFLAGGVIFTHGARVRGMTSAAAIWVTAAIGLLIGAGFILVAIMGIVASIFVLTPMKWIEGLMNREENLYRNHRKSPKKPVDEDVSDEASPE
jgi:putative Mg2+ transporter-C (MgtC) family protein